MCTSPKLRKFVDALPIPRVVEPKCKDKNSSYYEVTMRQVKQKLHSELPETTVWGYEGMYPGPTFDVLKGECVNVKWINQLPDEHLLPVDTSIHGAGKTNPRVRTVVHLHGGVTPPESDGYPEAWFTRDFEKVGPLFLQKIYQYPNNQDAATLWYHDHAVGITRLNVYAGLAGYYLIRDNIEEQLNLPKGSYEVPLLIQDRSFNADGSLYYPGQNSNNPSIVPEFFGDTILVNGKVWPFFNVEPRKYRFRIANGSNSRFYTLRLVNRNDKSLVPFIQIGTDNGFLNEPVIVNELTLAPAERADVIVDFSQLAGAEIIMRNTAPTVDGPVDPKTTGIVMKFNVSVPLSGTDTSSIPNKLVYNEKLSVNQACKVRYLDLVETTDEQGRLKLLIENKEWQDIISETPKIGTTEVWKFVNTTEDIHPMHLHLVTFQIVSRRPFDVDYYMSTGRINYTGPATPPDDNEKGPKDTVRANPGEVTTIIAKFAPFTGRYVYHCHILEHEDHEMMRPYEVVSSIDCAVLNTCNCYNNSNCYDMCGCNNKISDCIEDPYDCVRIKRCCTKD